MGKIKLLSLILALATIGESRVKADLSPSVQWRFVGNDTPSVGLCSAELTLTVPMEAKRSRNAQAVYFNFGRLPADSSDVAVEHVNGDLFRIELKPFEEGQDTCRWTVVSRGVINNLTDAPAGFYLVVAAANGEETVVPVETTVDLRVLHAAAKAIAPAKVSAEPRQNNGKRVASPPVIPQPRAFERRDGLVRLGGLPLVAAAEHAVAAELLSRTLVAAGGAPPAMLDAIAPGTPAIRLITGQADQPGTTGRQDAEAYSLELDPAAGVNVQGDGTAGVFYGVQTLIALIENAPNTGDAKANLALPAVAIQDAPHFRYRGLHLDVARNFQSVATVRRLFDLMAAYKLNRFHFHLTDDEGWRLAIRDLPELTEVGGRRGHSAGFGEVLPPSFGSGPVAEGPPGSGYYTRDEFVSLLRYAADRHIEVIPEIDVPGHSRAAIRAMHARYERLLSHDDRNAAEEFLLRRPNDEADYTSIQMWNDNVLDVRLASSRAFVEHVVADVVGMYEEAGLRLNTVHFGGDEVPHGCWGNNLDAAAEEALFCQFMAWCAGVAEQHGAQAAGWEEVFLGEEADASTDGQPAGGLCYAWNNVWGWGQEDVAYRLANAGTKVVLCNATHLYFDLAHSDSPDEPGYYWAGTTELREVFDFHPYEYLRRQTHDRQGNPIDIAQRESKAQLTSSGLKNVVGMQGHLWGENLTSGDRLDYMAFPRMLALAERAWCGPSDSAAGSSDEPRDWPKFSQHLGQLELPRLDRKFGGVAYRVPPVTLNHSGNSVKAIPQLPGMTIRYTTDRTEPSDASEPHGAALPVNGSYRFRAFDTRGRGGPIADWSPPP